MIAFPKAKESRIDGISYSFRVAMNQQLLNLWQPGTTLMGAIASIGVIGFIFIGFAILLNSLSTSLLEVTLRYDSVCSRNPICTVQFTLDADYASPIFLYYNLPTFFQNNRILKDLRSNTQMTGLDMSAANLTSCSPVIYNGNLSTKQSIGNNFLNPSDVAYPCGGVARSFFNGNLCP